MIDLKKIAEKIREIASFYGPNDGCTNAIYDALIAIADELDPPEPKPLLADAKVGDLCQRRDGNYITITKTQEEAPQYTFSDNISRNEAGCAFGVFMASFDIVSTEPLATEGTAEWALQMMKLGNAVTKQHLRAFGKIYWCYNERLRCIEEFNCGTLQIMVTPEIWVKTTDDKSGWQLYEPATEPKTETLAEIDAPCGSAGKLSGQGNSELQDEAGR